MSLPVFDPQTHLFGLQARSSEVFSASDRNRAIDSRRDVVGCVESGRADHPVDQVDRHDFLVERPCLVLRIEAIGERLPHPLGKHTSDTSGQPHRRAGVTSHGRSGA